MSVSRRGFLAGRVLPFSGAFIAARGMEAHLAEALQGGGGRALVPPGVKDIRISSNENPLGPGKAVLDAIMRQVPRGRPLSVQQHAERQRAGRRPSPPKFKVKPENVVLGAGSQEILKSAVRAFTSPSRALVTAAPSFENCTQLARRLGHPVARDQGRLRASGSTSTACSPACEGAGLVFLNNPNNPTATVHGSKAVTDFVAARARSLAGHGHPHRRGVSRLRDRPVVRDARFRSRSQTPNVFVARTFSKAYGMAGMRIGYAIGQADTIKPLAQLKMPYNVSVFGIAAAIAALGDPQHIEDERARNTEVRAFTVKALDDLGLQVDRLAGQLPLRRRRRGRRRSSATRAPKQGVMVGRDFPPFEKTHVRASRSARWKR